MKSISTPKSTGGGGYAFEDEVSAFFLAHLLRGLPPFGDANGALREVRFQTRSDGWILDDLLLICDDGVNPDRCAVSIKSSQQFKSNRAPGDFVHDAWVQYLKTESNVFDPSQDYLALAAPSPPRTCHEALKTLLGFAREQSPDLLARRFLSGNYVNARVRTLHSSFQCPEDLAKKHDVDIADTPRLLSRVILFDFDFDASNSLRKQQAMSLLRDATANQSLADAKKLWTHLLKLSTRYRTQSGSISLPTLISHLRPICRLSDFPEYSVDLQTLRKLTDSNTQLVKDDFGDRLCLHRPMIQEDIDEAFSTARLVALTGEAGLGKSAAAKHWLLKNRGDCECIWLNASRVEKTPSSSLQSLLGLNDDLRGILGSISRADARIVLDGIDRVSPEMSATLISELIHAIDKGHGISPWRILIPCRPETWEKVQSELTGIVISRTEMRIVPIRELDNSELEHLSTHFTKLSGLLNHTHLIGLLRRPKMLDLILSGTPASGKGGIESWVGESDLVEWYWESRILNGPDGPQRSRFVMEIAERQGDLWEGQSPVTAFKTSDLAPLHRLIADHVFSEHEGRVSFYHDLYSDWARYKAILANANQLSSYMANRIQNPRWHRALRLFAIHLLEQSADISRWQSSLQALSGDQLAVDLIVEAPIFASNPDRTLDLIWPYLNQNPDALRRLLNRFLFISTYADPNFLAILRALGEAIDTEAATFKRIPHWPYWLPMLRFLSRHLDELIEICPDLLARISDSWLRFSANDWPCRQEAAELGMNVAERVIASRLAHVYVMNPKDTIIPAYRAGLAAILELPERVESFALIASGRVPITGNVATHFLRELDEHKEREAKYADLPKRPEPPLSTPFSVRREADEPWPDGPKYSVDHDFQSECLETDALHPVMATNPKLAKEILLAILIERRMEQEFPFGGHAIHDSLGCAYGHRMFPPMFNRGPFLPFLRVASDEALDFVVRLVDFVTDRFLRQYSGHASSTPGLHLLTNRGRKFYQGEYRSFYWYRNLPPCPNTVVSCLMALERWMYEELDAGRDVESVALRLFEQSNSVAILGVLSALAAKQPSLLRGPLRPLLGTPELYYWQFQYTNQPHDYLMIGWAGKDRFQLKIAQNWNALPHRSTDFTSLAQVEFLRDEETQQYLTDRAAEWRGQLDSIQDQHFHFFVRSLIEKFDINNYHPTEDPEHGDCIAFVPPTELQRESAESAKGIEDQWELLKFPLDCRKYLNDGTLPGSVTPDGFWERLSHISTMKKLATELGESFEIEKSLCGGAAVLFILQRDWLRRNPEIETWCRESLVATILQPPKPAGHDISASILDSYWHCFCANALPVLWAEDPDSQELRQCIALLSTHVHYKTIEMLFAAAAARRRELGERFRQLQRFALEYSQINAPSREAYRSAKDAKSLKRRVSRLIRKFADDKIPSEVIPLPISKPSGTAPQENASLGRHRVTQCSFGFDASYIMLANSWIPPLTQASSPLERSEWSDFWKRALSVTLSSFGPVPSDSEMQGPIFHWDHWVIRGITSCVSVSGSKDEAQSFWQPLLELGGPGSNWIEEYFTDWFAVCLSSDPPDHSHMSRWMEMIEWALASPIWQHGRASHTYDSDKIWCNLMGLSAFGVVYWEPKGLALSDELKSLYIKWGESYRFGRSTFGGILRFLKLPIASPLWPEGLSWIERCLSSPDEREYLLVNNRGAADDLARLLAHIWDTELSKADSVLQIRRVFQSLLNLLVELQNPIALQLSQSVMGSSEANR